MAIDRLCGADAIISKAMMEAPQQVNTGQKEEPAGRGALHGAFAALLELGIACMVRVHGAQNSPQRCAMAKLLSR